MPGGGGGAERKAGAVSALRGSPVGEGPAPVRARSQSWQTPPAAFSDRTGTGPGPCARTPPGTHGRSHCTGCGRSRDRESRTSGRLQARDDRRPEGAVSRFVALLIGSDKRREVELDCLPEGCGTRTARAVDANGSRVRLPVRPTGDEGDTDRPGFVAPGGAAPASCSAETFVFLAIA